MTCSETIAPIGPAHRTGRTPERRPGSVRRTSSLDATWPEGPDGPVKFEGNARDIVTGERGGKPSVTRHAHIDAVANGRDIVEIRSTPDRPELTGLSGTKAGSSLRGALDALVRDERIAGTPLYLLLDDLAGATLVASWTISRWKPHPTQLRSAQEGEERIRRIEGICIGFRPGSTAFAGDGRVHVRVNASPALALHHPDDPEGWHQLPDAKGMHFRRARWIDVWRTGGLLHVDAGFQDSGSTPSDGRMTVHEYAIQAIVDGETQKLLRVSAAPTSSLPFQDCLAAPANIGAMLGSPLSEFRAAVPRILGRSAGCTHLNDALRALADVPQLARDLSHEPTDRNPVIGATP